MIGITRMARRATATDEATGQSRFWKNSSASTRPIIGLSPRPMSEGITYSPVAGMKTSMAPATIPGTDKGSVMSLNTCQGLEPRSIAEVYEW